MSISNVNITPLCYDLKIQGAILDSHPFKTPKHFQTLAIADTTRSHKNTLDFAVEVDTAVEEIHQPLLGQLVMPSEQNADEIFCPIFKFCMTVMKHHTMSSRTLINYYAINLNSNVWK